MGILQLFTLIGALGMFLYGMNLMSSGLQKASGDKLRGFLSAMTSNPFKGVATGLGITTVIQSSSATTVMVVSFVNAGLLSLSQAIGVIMGANIGTTVTAWLVAWLGFKADISILAIPLMALGFLFSNSKKNQRQNIGELIVGFCLLFLGLSFMKESVPDLNETPQVLEFVKTWSSHGFGSVLIFLLFGTVLTLVLQSSSATMAITLIMLSMGWIPFNMACAMVLGENIGTTITANIAASVGNTQAKRAAMSHTIFNLFGVLWALALFTPFLALVGSVIELFGLPNPAAEGFVVTNPTSADGTAALYGLSMLHTLFNAINTLILIWFVKYIEKAVVYIIKMPKDQENESFRLKYISAGPVATCYDEEGKVVENYSGLEWKVESNENDEGKAVIELSNQGVVTPLNRGMVQVYVRNKIAQAICHVTVKEAPVKVQKIKLSPASKRISVGKTFQLKAEVLPENAEDKSMTYYSDDETIATVTQDGLVTGVANTIGDKKIYIGVLASNGVESVCEVQVADAWVEKNKL